MFISSFTSPPSQSPNRSSGKVGWQPKNPASAAQPRFSNAAILTASGGLMAAMGPIQKLMSYIESNKIIELAISDIGAMVLPRTYLEYKQRGVIPARETLFREAFGTLTNTFLVGWLGYLGAAAFGNRHFNPLAMDYKAVVDTKTLEFFGNTVTNILDKNKQITADELRQHFLQEVLGRLESTDNIATLPQYKDYLSDQGKLGKSHIQGLIDRYLGKAGEGHHAYKVEEEILQQMRQPHYRAQVTDALREAEEAFRQKLGSQEGLSAKQQQTLTALLDSKKRSIRATQWQQIRSQITKRIRSEEKVFLDHLYNYAIRKGKLSDEVFLLDSSAGKPIESIGAKPTRQILANIKYFMEEFLNRGLATNETSGAIEGKALLKRLYTDSQASWIEKLRNLRPSPMDGLITYAYKSRFFTTLIPVAVGIATGCLAVVVNNWLTRRKLGGSNAFPGELVFTNQGKGGNV